MEWKGEAATAAVSKAMKGALVTGAEMVLAKSNAEVPVDEGTLLRGGTVNPSDGGKVQTISYNETYAVKQHEDLGLNHPNGGKAKYLEDPMNANGGKVLTLIANAANNAMKG